EPRRPSPLRTGPPAEARQRPMKPKLSAPAGGGPRSGGVQSTHDTGVRTTVSRRFPMTQSTILRQAAADAEFRHILLADPSAFGVSADSVPVSVEQPDAASLEFWTRGQGAMETVACRTSCSWGPFTVVCDGSTKWFRPEPRCRVVPVASAAGTSPGGSDAIRR